MTSSDSTRLIFLAIIIGAVNALTLLFVVFIQSDEEPAALELDKQDELRVFQSLAESVNRLSQQIGDRTEDSSAPRRSATPSMAVSPRSQDLAPVLEKLTQIMDRLAQTPGGVAVPSASDRRQAMANPEVAKKNFTAVSAMPEKKIRQDHQLMSFDEVIARYGNPESMYFGQTGQLYVRYRDPALRTSVEFGFHNNMVVYVSSSRPR